MNNIKRNKNGQFEKGTSPPNPKGRPKGSITRQLREFMNEIDDNGFNRMQHLCFIVWDKALKGDLQAIKLIMDRVDGKPRQTMEVERNNEPIQILSIEDQRQKAYEQII